MQQPARQWGWIPLVLILAGFAGGLAVRKAKDTGQPLAAVGEPLFSQRILASREAPPSLSEGEYFYQLTRMLEQTYVDGVKDEDSLASGAVRGMIGSLADPLSTYLPKDQMAALSKRLAGTYEGIGLELSLRYDQNELKKLQDKSPDVDLSMLPPVLEVTAVPEGTPAAKAGLQPGDRIVGLDGRAVLSALDIKELRSVQEKADKKLIPWSELESIRESYRKKSEHNYPASRARELMTTGSEGTLKVEWMRQNTPYSASVKKAVTQVPPLVKQADGSFKIRFIRGLQDALLKERLPGKDVVLDLRGTGQGDTSVLKSVLEEISAPGIYGSLVTEKDKDARPLAVRKGLDKPGKLTLLVDKTTHGAAEIFALALSSQGQAKLKGSSMAGERAWVETFSVQGGDGYSLVTGLFRPGGPAAAVKTGGEKK